QFRVRKTSRFAYSPDGVDKHRVCDEDGNIEYYLEPATQEKYLNKTRHQFSKIVRAEHEGQFSKSTKIQCLNKTQFNRMYINARGELYPCCFLSNDTYPGSAKVHKDLSQRLAVYENGFNSLRAKSWENILEHPWFRHELTESWESDQDKPIRCQRTCSVKCNPITSQSQDLSL
ncbi:MAG: hypothetical protein AAF203_03285, partial [Pseudomonadota bacterium]